MSLSLPPIESQLVALLETRFKAAVDIEIEEAKKRLEDRMRMEAAKVAINLSKFFDVETLRDSVTIRVHTKDLKML